MERKEAEISPKTRNRNDITGNRLSPRLFRPLPDASRETDVPSGACVRKHAP